MKATGIIRKIDALGRIVIPKETRRALHINDDDPMEIYVGGDGEVIFKKYSSLSMQLEKVAPYAEFLNRLCNTAIAICDKDTIIAGADCAEILNKRIAPEVESIMRTSRLYQHDSESEGKLYLTANCPNALFVTMIMPIRCDSDIIGCIAVLGDSDYESKLITATAKLISDQIGCTP